MKIVFGLSLFIVSLASFSQADTLCNQFPLTRVDKIANDKGALAKIITSHLAVSLKKGNHFGVFKLIVDCNGVATTINYQKGDLTNAEQRELITLIRPVIWSAAVHKEKKVTSTVFVSINIEDGKVEVIVQ